MPYHRIATVSDEVLKTCESEPIHIPESIQPHGTLLVVDAKGWMIDGISQNAQEYLGMSAEELCGKELRVLFGNSAAWSTTRQRLELELNSPSETRQTISLEGRFSNLICECHCIGDDRLILELERPSVLPGDSRQEDLLGVIREASAILDHGEEIDSVMAVVSRAIRRFTGYDRVMIYKMDQDGHGAVVAEAKRNDLPPYLGLHFPASDIPKQARKLYIRNRVRLLSDVSYAPVPLLRTGGVGNDGPIDMSLCHLRSISPVHVEYLQNMGVRATLVISIVIDNRLWGLIACHHYTPRHLDATIRNRCEQLAHFTSAVVGAEDQRQQRRSIESSHQLQQSLVEIVGTGIDWQKRFLKSGCYLLDQMGASGLALYDAGEYFTLGDVPYSGMLEKVRRLLQPRMESGVAMTDALKYEDEALAGIGADYSGCLLWEISQDPATQLIWFRKEQRRYVDWGGDPRKSLLYGDDPNARLSPRKSFEKWTQLVEGQSQPWTEQDMHRARAIGQFVASRKVEDASRRQSQFLANVSHEIRTPMTAILGFTDVLSGNSQEAGTSAERAKAITSIRNHGEHLLSIVDHMFCLCHLEAGSQPIERERISTAAWIEDLRSRFTDGAAQHGLEFGCDVSGPVPRTIVSDRQLLQRLLDALFDNAIKFTDDGTIAFTFMVAPKQPGYVEVLIEDSGSGLAPEDAKRIFQSFYQADGTLTRKQGGVGLGLTLARQIAESLGGTLRLKGSTPGLGTTFSLTLPIGHGEIDDLITIMPARGSADFLSSRSAEDETPTPLLGCHVLLVEDNADNQRLIAFHLRRAGAHVAMAENGKIALEMVQRLTSSKESLDVILMDMQMPVMDGYNATQQLRQSGCGVPIIAVTAHAMTGERERCLQCGCNEYVTKPVDYPALNQMILALTEDMRVMKVGDIFPE